MVDKNRSPKYTYLKDGIYYFSRLVPHDLKDHYSKPRIVFVSTEAVINGGYY